MNRAQAVDYADTQDRVGSEEVVFYSWIDAGTQSQPSSLTVRISGGQRAKDSNGNIMALGYKEVRFNMGLLRTSDREVIREIRKMIQAGETITEDKEVYLSYIEPSERRSKRLAMRASQLTNELAEKDKMIADLQAKLARKPGRVTAEAGE